MTVKTGNPETDAMFAELAQLTREQLDVPNELVPEEYRDNRGKTTSLDFMERRFQRNNPGPTQHELDEAEKRRRIEIYRNQLQMEPVQNGEPKLIKPFTYEVDERRQYLTQVKFCGAMVQAGVMDLDD